MSLVALVLIMGLIAMSAGAGNETQRLESNGFGLEIRYEPIPGVPIVGQAKTAPLPAAAQADQLRGASQAPLESDQGVRVTNQAEVAAANSDRVDAIKPVTLVRPPDATIIPIEQPETEPDLSGRPPEPGQDAWTIIKSETFEGSFPGTPPNAWTLWGAPTWGKRSYKPHAGSWSGYCVGSGTARVYPNNTDAWMVFGPFTLAGYVDAKVDFYRWLRSEVGYDYLIWAASTDDINYYGWQEDGIDPIWRSVSFDLRNVPGYGNFCGQPSVYIAFIFQSDVSNIDTGAYIDDIVIQRNNVAGQPDLFAGYTPTGWDFPIVPSNVVGTNTVGPDLNDFQPTFVDWAVLNQGRATALPTFYTYLYQDGRPVAGWYVDSLPMNYYVYVEDDTEWVTSGTHTLGLFTDSTNVVLESDETNNKYFRSWTWRHDTRTLPNLTYYTPTGWAFPIVPSNIKGTHTVGALNDYDSTYVDWAVVNNGNIAAKPGFYTYLYLDSRPIAAWYPANESLPAMTYMYVDDYGEMIPAGTHTLGLFTDSTNAVTESREDDNKWSNSWVWAHNVNAKANLTYYQPTGWDYPIVPSNVPGTHTVGPNLTDISTTYVDLSFVNMGNYTAKPLFYTYLYWENTPIRGWTLDSLQPWYYVTIEDDNGFYPAGTHVLATTVDSTRTVPESNEGDNHYSHSFTWTAANNDVGCTRIMVPSGIVDSNYTATPACSVYNYGSTTPGSYTVRMKIGNRYNYTATTSGPAPGVRAYVTFPLWTAQERGSLAVSCSTELTGDLVRANDKAIGGVTVNVTDVGCTKIIAPAGTYDDGTIVTPACSVYNFGTTTPGSYTVRMKIGASYNVTASITGPAPGGRTYVAFTNWTATPVGTYTVSCSTELATDQDRSNDKKIGSVIVAPPARTDVGVSHILAPPGALDSGATTTPACSVENFGNTTPGSYTVRMKIGAGYNNTATISGPAPNARIYVTFPNWTAGARGSYPVSCSTELTTDQTRGNDKLTSSVNVNVTDVGCERIFAPAGTIDSGTSVTPACSVQNYGTTTPGSYTVRMKINTPTPYNNPVTISGPAPGAMVYVTFPVWIASPVGGPYAVSCSTELATDQKRDDDKATGSVTVRQAPRTDVGCTHLLAPAGVFDSGATTTPACSVYNFGNQTPGSYTVRMKIGTRYDNQATISGPAPGVRIYVTFPLWTAQERGTGLAVSCSTELGDALPGNDKATGSVTVNVSDVGCPRILAPAGTIDSGTSVTPACSVYNWGTTTPGSYTVRMKIGGSYNNPVTITGPAPGNGSYVTFPVWIADPIGGPYSVTCSTELAADQKRENDKANGSVIVAAPIRADVGVSQILAPRGDIDSGTTVTPACSVYNYGSTTPGTYTVRMKIAPSYDYTASVSGPAPGGLAYVTFPSWLAQPRGTLAVSCSTELAGDAIPGNDKLIGSVKVNVSDVGCTRIMAPSGAFDSGATATPACSVYNYGATTPGSYTVRMKIGAGYNNTATISGPAPGARLYVTFPLWTARERGDLAVSCSTELASDVVAGNDKAIGSVSVAVHDVAAEAIVAPVGTVPPGTVTPQARVHNYSTAREPDVDVTFMINSPSPYQATVNLPAGLPLGVDTVIAFTDWTATSGTYTARCSTYLAADQVAANNVVWADFQVSTVAHDVGATGITAPLGAIDTAATVFPAALVKNFGEAPETFTAWFWIKNLGGAVYTGSTLITGLSVGKESTVTFSAWPKPHAIGDYTTKCSTALTFDASPVNDFKTGAFTVTALPPPAESGWSQNADVPPGPKSKRVKDGAALAYKEGDTDADSNYIYALKGNNRCEFYRYNIATNAWAAKESIPAIGRLGKKKTVKKGGTLAKANDKLYATKGNNSLEFWEYSPLTDDYPWVQKADVPVGAKNVKEGTGTAPVTLGETTYVYLLKGSNTLEFYRFNTLANAWETRASAPAGLSGRSFKNGSCITVSEDGKTIYALKGSYNEFFAYQVDSNFWATKTGLPLIGASGRKKKVKDGAGIAYHNGRVYGLKGGNTQEFWKYLADSNRWIQGTDIPIGGGKRVKGGGALVYAPIPNALYATKGNNTFEFWKYGLGATSYPLSADNPAQNATGKFAFDTPQLALRIAPNPFKGAATISYALPRTGSLRLDLYDVSGALVTMLASGHHYAGNYTLRLDAAKLSRGIYLLKLENAGCTRTEKLIIE
jgi:hypothetical protein